MTLPRIKKRPLTFLEHREENLKNLTLTVYIEDKDKMKHRITY